MIGKELEVNLHYAFVTARRDRHQFITVEHLLLALLDNPSARAVLNTCGANVEDLRRKLRRHIAQHTPVAAPDQEVDTQPTMGFQRVVQRAIMQIQGTAKNEVTGAEVLAAICRERDSHAVYFLSQDGVDVFNVTKAASRAVSGPGGGRADSETTAQREIDKEETRQIVLLYDDKTPADFVLAVLEEFLLLDREDAAEVLEEARSNGKAICGLFPRETAEFVLQQISAHARKHGHPLRCVAAVQW
jgi:ATP-dependent Clp protease adapter protein ClpS